MAETKTKPTPKSVDKFIEAVEDEQKRDDSHAIIEMMSEITGHEPRMWGETMIGFDSYHYKYASGHEGDAFVIGFAPRKANLVLYVMPTEAEKHTDLIDKLGKCKTSKGCLYVKRLSDIDQKVLKELMKRSVKEVKNMWG